jgi:hypothetical protein
MFNKKKQSSDSVIVTMDFSPEEIVKVLSDVNLTLPVTDQEYSRIMSFIDQYKNRPPKMLVKIVSQSGAELRLTNFQLFYAGQNQIAPGEPECT